MAYQLKNPNIALANPNAIANRAYVDALYQELTPPRNATDREFKTLTANHPFVKDITNIILGSPKSPFSAGNLEQTRKVNKYLQSSGTTSSIGRVPTIEERRNESRITEEQARKILGDAYSPTGGAINRGVMPTTNTGSANSYTPPLNPNAQETNVGYNFSWKNGLSDGQKTGIKNLVDRMRNGYKPNDTDKKNLAEAIGSNWQEQIVTSSYSSPNFNSSKVYDPLAEAAKYGYTAADFANDPNFVSYWSKKTPTELKIALSNRSDFDKSNGIKKTIGTVASESAMERYVNSLVANGSITQEDAPAILEILTKADNKTGTAMTDDEIEAKFNDVKAAVVLDQNKYYTEKTNRELSDFKTSLDDIRNEALRYTQKEQKSYNELLAETKKGLRAKGMTFSGSSVKRLGSESSQINPTNLEGEIPQKRRYDWEDTSAGFQERARDAGMAAERLLGSGTLDSNMDYLKPTGLPDPYGKGTTYRTGATRDLYLPHQSDQTDYVKYGDLELEKLRTIEEETNRRMSRINTLK